MGIDSVKAMAGYVVRAGLAQKNSISYAQLTRPTALSRFFRKTALLIAPHKSGNIDKKLSLGFRVQCKLTLTKMLNFRQQNQLRQLGDAIKTARKLRAVTQNEMAIRAGVSRQSVIALEKGSSTKCYSLMSVN